MGYILSAEKLAMAQSPKEISRPRKSQAKHIQISLYLCLKGNKHNKATMLLSFFFFIALPYLYFFFPSLSVTEHIYTLWKLPMGTQKKSSYPECIIGISQCMLKWLMTDMLWNYGTSRGKKLSFLSPFYPSFLKHETKTNNK